LDLRIDELGGKQLRNSNRDSILCCAAQG
jgi:hypothetical protein